MIKTDEIYFSEAVYLAMNKAEVPGIEVGSRELKGISKPVKIFSIPRFAQHRLVPEPETETPEDPHLGYQYGGMHLSGSAVAQKRLSQEVATNLLTKQNIAVVGAVAAALFMGALFFNDSRDSTVAPNTTAAAIPLAITPTTQPINLQPTPQAPSQLGDTPAPVTTVVPTTAPVQTPSTVAASAPDKPKGPTINTIQQAKMAYRSGRITKDRYRSIVERLEEELDMAIRRAKTDYREGRISKDTYKTRVRGLKLRYEGE